jgi:hypothetical protein
MGDERIEAGRDGIGFVDRAELDAQGLAEMAAIQELFLRRIRTLGEESAQRSKETGEELQPFDFYALLKADPEGTELDDEARAKLEEEVAELRRDPDFMGRIERRVEEDRPVLDRLSRSETDPR